MNRPNGFELIYCENGSQHHNGPMDMRRPFNKNCYPIPELIPADVKKRLNGKEKPQEQVVPFKNIIEDKNNFCRIISLVIKVQN